jgi:hypothetical protein
MCIDSPDIQLLAVIMDRCYELKIPRADTTEHPSEIRVVGDVIADLTDYNRYRQKGVAPTEFR